MSTLTISHSLHQFGAKSPLETSDLLGISVNKLSSIPCEVIESLQVFIQALIPLGQLHELCMLDCHETKRNIISLESRLELIPSDLGISEHSGPMTTPPNTSWPMQLVRCILSLQHLSQAKQTKLLLESVQPLISLEGLFSLLEDRWFSVKEIFEVAILIWFWSLACTTTITICNHAESLRHSALSFHKNCHQFHWCG